MRLTNISRPILELRYFLKDDEGRVTETEYDMVRRVARHVASGEKLYGKSKKEIREQSEKYFNLIWKQDFFPNSPTFTGAGTPLGQLSACFVLPIEDSLVSIYKTMSDAALTHQTGGGTGFSFSRLRPKNDRVRSSKGVASGPVSFLEVYNASTEAIKQGGTRRGANMGVLRVDHPDILDFISCKDDTTKITNFNISVGITDAFMEAKERGALYSLINPKDNTVVGKLDANEVWNTLIENAWKTGEPGIIFLDRMNRRNPNNHTEIIEATNPCWTGDTKVWTANGPVTFKELARRGQDVEVLSQDEDGKLVFKTMRNPRLTRRNTSLVKITLDDGTELRCTPNHNLYLKDGTKVMAKNLKSGDSIASVYRYKANQSGYLRLSNGIETPLEHHVVAELKYGRRPNYPKEHTHHINGDKQDNRPQNLEILEGRKHNSDHMRGKNNPMFKVWDERNPLFNVDVKGKNNPRYREDINDEELQYMRNKLGMSYEAIAEGVGCSKYTVMKRLGWTRPDSREAVANHKVVEIKRIKTREDVYNGTVDDTNRYFVMCGEDDAILSANCGEQPLPPYGSCNLGSINLANFVLFPYTDRATVNWFRLTDVVRDSVHFLDNVIDVNKYPIPELEEKAKKDRRIGLGVMGWHEMLVQLGLPYDSEEAFDMGRRVMSYIKKVAVDYSATLAYERGTYPEWEGSQWSVEGYRVRNATLTTVAPTGTISIMASTPEMPCSGGIEPKFALVFTRNQAEMLMLDVDAQFESIARKEGWYSEELMQKVADNHGSPVGIEGIPEKWQQIFKTSHDISPEAHIRMQSAFQGTDDDDVITQPLDSACSKTINFPNHATVEDVRKGYELAYELGLKGVTVYRDGSRQFQVLTTGNKVEEKKEEEYREHTEDYCPEGGTVKYESGCHTCTCGWSVCSV